MDTQLEKLIENVVKELKSEYPSVLFPAYILGMVTGISGLETDDKKKAINYFVSLVRKQTPELFVVSSQGDDYQLLKVE